ncbi:MAG: hypothetical protein L0Z62_38765 [Gemmataceae bacterium]|nr:hypothetical protein [Gemmataceae bacterium]
MAHKDRQPPILACLFRHLFLGVLSAGLILSGSATPLTAEETEVPWSAPGADLPPALEEDEDSSAPSSSPRTVRRLSRRRPQDPRPVQPDNPASSNATGVFRSTGFPLAIHSLSAHPVVRGASLPLRC